MLSARFVVAGEQKRCNGKLDIRRIALSPENVRDEARARSGQEEVEGSTLYEYLIKEAIL